MTDQIITRYMDLGRFVAMIGNWPESPKGRLFFACADQLGDPMEGTLGVGDRALAIEGAKSRYRGTQARAMACWLTRDWPDRLLMVGISCWYLGGTESHAMWQAYGTGGVAIESTVDKVKSALGSSDVKAKAIEYNEHTSRPSTGLDPTKVLSFKRTPYRHEQELRMFISFTEEERDLIKNLRGLGRHGETLIHRRPQGDLGPRGMTVPFDVVHAVDRVVLAPGAPVWLKNTIFQQCAAIGIDTAKVRESILDGDPYAEFFSGMNQNRLGCDELATQN